ncbi:TOMM precursor leader peptide-binding protein [Aureivirga sp. CE67]|uniref:TOMM precursor leader peptide-binding protein n=1 Tax=Aureivirga sp. CE67 TaxID=1788983 RepID=UPI0018C96126|nr:TOMM precursor leader peptide-binding protein [Aureivirga sp. CE67]
MLEKFDIFKDTENNCFQLRTKTVSYTLDFDDPEKESIFTETVDLVQGNPRIRLASLKKKLQKKFDDAKILEVLTNLKDYQLLNYHLVSEMNNQSKKDAKQDIADSQDRINPEKNIQLGIIGGSDFYELLVKQAKKNDFKKVYSANYSSLNTDAAIEKIVSQSDFILVDGNQWSPYHIERINEIALKLNKPWLYIGGLENNVFKIGPLFFGKETGCYNCLASRAKSNHSYPSFLNAYENFLRENKKVGMPDSIPTVEYFHNILIQIAFLEVTKFFESWSLPATWRTYLSINPIDYSQTQHTLLKVPYCEVCKPELKYNPAPWLEAITLK